MTAAAEPFNTPDELDDVLAGPEPEWDDAPEPPPDVARADQMVYRLGSIDLARKRDAKAADARIQQIKDWLSRRDTANDRQEAWLRAALRRYHEAVLLLDPKRLSISLPSGDLVSRQGQREWVVDEERVLAWAFPEAAAASFGEELARFRERLDWIFSNLGVQGAALKVGKFPDVTVSRSGLKEYGIRRDAKDKAIAWGFDPEGNPIPGVTVTPPERNFNVVLRSEHVPDEPFPPYEGGLTAEDDR